MPHFRVRYKEGSPAERRHIQELERHEAEVGTVRCIHCPWRHEGRLLAGARAHKEHRQAEHPAPPPKTRRPGPAKKPRDDGGTEQRARILAALRIRGAARATELATELGLSPTVRITSTLDHARRAGQPIERRDGFWLWDGASPPPSEPATGAAVRIRELLGERGPMAPEEIGAVMKWTPRGASQVCGRLPGVTRLDDGRWDLVDADADVAADLR